VKKLTATQIRSSRNASIVYEFALRDLQEDASKPKGPVVVILEGKIVGKIRPMDEGGYAYQPKNAGVVGETFPTLRACQISLEVDSE
jgi:hypothetical protein